MLIKSNTKKKFTINWPKLCFFIYKYVKRAHMCKSEFFLIASGQYIHHITAGCILEALLSRPWDRNRHPRLTRRLRSTRHPRRILPPRHRTRRLP